MATSVRVSRLLHAGYLIEAEGKRILFDPIFETPFSRNCYAFPEVSFDLEALRAQHFDAVFISHYHDDHFSLESLNLIARETPIYFYCVHDELFSFLREMKFQSVHRLNLETPIRVGSIEVTARRALQDDVDSLLHVRVGHLNILNVVDSWIDDEMLKQLQLTDWDLVMWPFQSMREVEVMAPRQAAAASPEIAPELIAQLRALEPRFVIPSSCQFRFESWSWKNDAFFPISYAKFAETLARECPASTVVRLNPSCTIDLSRDGQREAPLAWIQPVGDQDVDYTYNPRPQPTSEIARHFGPVTEAQRERARAFCETELSRRYKAVGAPAEPYFKRARQWRLSLYDERGEAMIFEFRIDEEQIERRDGRPEWTTEIPLKQLLAALEDGESLSSLYVRINDFEGAPADVDVIDDPLVRCLFNGELGSYQAAQLVRLRDAEARGVSTFHSPARA